LAAHTRPSSSTVAFLLCCLIKHFYSKLCRLSIAIIDLFYSWLISDMVNLKYHVRYRFLQPEALNTSEKYAANLRTFMSKYDEIKSEHRGEFIAISDGDIIGDTSREALLEKIRQKVEDKDIDSVFQTYISKTDDIIW
jgi:hypothetical protein